MSWEYECDECGARVSSGWADHACPMPTCGAVMRLVSGPEPSPSDVADVVRGAEKLLAGACADAGVLPERDWDDHMRGNW